MTRYRNLASTFQTTAAGRIVPHPAHLRYLQALNLGKVALAAQYAEELGWLVAHNPRAELPDTTVEFRAFTYGREQ